MDSRAKQGPLSVEDYLELEESATVRHEYVAGEIYALAGASRRHSQIAGNIFAALRQGASGSTCRVHQSDMKLQVDDDAFYYPDVIVACGTEPENPYLENDPCLVVEVVSPSTESIDRREKLAAYKRMAGLKAYLIVSQERMWVERHLRDEEGVWRKADLVEEGCFPVPCPPGTELSLGEIYEDL